MLPAFINFALLGGLIGIAAPVLIHLLLKRRSQRLRFSTVQFFIKKDEQSMRKRKLRNLLLLALRVMVFTLIVLAFARPFLPHSLVAPRTVKHQQAILLLDTSASMQSVGAAGSQWKRAKEMAKQVLVSLQADDRAALVLCSSQTSVASGFVAPSIVLKKLEDVEPTFGTADLTEGLQQALKVFTTADPAYETSLHVISDLQRQAAQNLSTVPLPEKLAVKIPDLGDRFIANVAVTDLHLEREDNSAPHATITSFSDENYSGLPFHLKIDGKEVLSGTVALPGGAATNLALAIPALAPGWHSAEFTVQSKDGLPVDDTRFTTILTPDPIRCLVVETRQTDRPYLEESYFVRTALNPAASGEVSSSRFVYEKISPEKLPAGLQQKPGQGAVQLVVLTGAKQLPAVAVEALRTFTRKGGGLLLFLGEGVSANSYNTQLNDLLPAELGRVEAGADAVWHIGEFQKTSPIFSLFRAEGNGNLALPEFTHRFTLKANTNAIVTAAFDDGVPLVLERKYGQGRVILVNSSADTRWTDWQKRKSFVAWLHSAGTYLVEGDSMRQREAVPSFGTGAEIDLAVALKEQAVRIVRAGAEESTLQTDVDGVVRDLKLAVPGIYSVKSGAGGELRRIAANIPSAESDLALLAPAETEQQLVRRTEPENVNLAAGLFGESPKGKELWRLMLLGSLLFLVVEPLVANRTAA
jgi:hypothetical protein